MLITLHSTQFVASSSRATELVKDSPENVVIICMGHSKRIAQKHYLQVTEGDYKQAIANQTQIPAPKITVSPRRGSQPILSAHEKTLVLRVIANTQNLYI